MIMLFLRRDGFKIQREEDSKVNVCLFFSLWKSFDCSFPSLEQINAHKRLSIKPANVCLSAEKKATALKRFVLSSEWIMSFCYLSPIRPPIGNQPECRVMWSDVEQWLAHSLICLCCCCVDSLNYWILETIQCLKQNCNKPAKSDLLLQRPDWLLFKLCPLN